MKSTIGVCQCLSLLTVLTQATAANKGSFANPPNNVKPKFRYWIPDASVDTTRVAYDFAEAKRVGMGGLEALGFYLYGPAAGTTVPVDWNTYGWGTPAWNKVLSAAASAAQKNDMLLDLPLGPSQGAGVPAEPDDEGLEWDLVYETTTLATCKGTQKLPGWGRGTLQAAVVGKLISNTSATGPGNSLPISNDNVDGQHYLAVLSAQSLQDVTKSVSSTGVVTLSDCPAPAVAGNTTLFAYYLTKTGQRAVNSPLDLAGPQTAPTDFIHNGSWVVDHFSAKGAQITIGFWNHHILNDATLKSLLQSVGNYFWEDSSEIAPTIYWTKDLLKAFNNKRGYSLNKYLPLLFHQNSLAPFPGSPPLVGATWYVTDDTDGGNKYIADYRTTLAELYSIYLTTLNDWADSQKLKFSTQVSYNMAMDMQANIPKVDVPETESLGFNHLIDGYRQYAGPAHLAGKQIISTEIGAEIMLGYAQTFTNLVWNVGRSAAGGVNAYIFHGLPYSGSYPNTTWPGYTTFNYLFSEMHGPRQPGWDFYSDFMGFVARTSFIFQSGVPKFDIAFYSKYTTYSQIETLYTPNDLVAAGYTYEYLSPDNFNLPAAVVKNGVLAPDRQAFKAMVIRANDSLTIQAVDRLNDFSKAGLPLIFSGGVPSTIISNVDAAAQKHVKDTLKAITSRPNTHVVSYTGLAKSLASLGITPRTSVAASSLWNTFWTQNGDQGYLYVYNDANAAYNATMSTGSITVATTGTPSLLNPWDGSQTAITNFTATKTSITIPLQLAGNQAAILAFDTSKKVSTGYGNKPAYSCPKAIQTLANWKLVVEHWDPPADLNNIVGGAKRYNTTHTLSKLVSWQQIDGLQSVSGRGYYSTTFQWAGNAGPQSVYINLGSIIHTARVSVNGHTLPPLDITWATADITKYLQKGKNTVNVVVTTNLYNIIKTVWPQTKSSGSGWTVPPLAPNQDYGLINNVQIISYASSSKKCY